MNLDKFTQWMMAPIQWNAPTEVITEPTTLDGWCLWLDFETSGLLPDTHQLVLGSAYALKPSGQTVWLDIRTEASLGSKQVRLEGPNAQTNPPLIVRNSVVLAFNIGFERSWLGPSGYNNSNLWLDVRSLVDRTIQRPPNVNSLADVHEWLLNRPLDKSQQQAATTYDADIKELANYCRQDVMAMLEIWAEIKYEHQLCCPNSFSLSGQVLAGSMVTHLRDWPEWLAKTEATYQQQLDVVGTALQEHLAQVQAAHPAWTQPCPRKKADKQDWQAQLVTEFDSVVAKMVGLDVGVLDLSSLPPKVSLTSLAAKFRSAIGDLAAWSQGEPLAGLGKAAMAALVGATWRQGPDTWPLLKTESGWTYNGLPLLDRKGAPVKGHSPFTKDALYYRAATETEPERPGIETNLHLLQEFLVETAFWSSIRSRAKALPVTPASDGYYRHLPQPQISATYTGRTVDPFWLVLAAPKPGRLGMDIRLRLQARPGHKLVRFDFDSQEVRLMLYWNAKIGHERWGWPNHYTNSAYAVAEVTGNQADGTDPHSLFGRKVGMSRQQGKQLSFSLQFGGGKRTLMFNSGLTETQAESVIEGYRGTKVVVENWLGEPEPEFQDGMTSGYSTMCLYLTEQNARTLFGSRPRRTLQPVGQLTLGNFPVQGSGVDLRDLLLTKLYSRVSDRLGWPLVMVLHDEQVFEVPEPNIDWFCTQLAEVHAEVYRELNERVFGNAQVCPEKHWKLSGAEVYQCWHKDAEAGGGYLWVDRSLTTI